MWKVRLTNWLFGWHWVATEHGGDTKYCRVRKYPNGKQYFRMYWTDYDLDGKPLGNASLMYERDFVKPITW